MTNAEMRWCISPLHTGSQLLQSVVAGSYIMTGVQLFCVV